MRLVKRFSHERYLIELHQYNQKYILKISLDRFEQIFKIDEGEVQNMEIFDQILESDFLSGCLTRFVSMREDFLTELNNSTNE